jgi:integrase/recombinase XerC
MRPTPAVCYRKQATGVNRRQKNSLKFNPKGGKLLLSCSLAAFWEGGFMYKKSCKLKMLVCDYVSVNKRIALSTAALTKRAFDELADLAGNVEVTDLTNDDAEIFQAYLVEKGLSKTTANIWCKSINPVLNWALNRGLIGKNPFANLKKFRIPRRQIRTFDSAEIGRLLDIANDLWKARILLGLSTMRKGEVLNLTVQDVDFERMMIRIQAKRKTAYTWAWLPKDYQARIIPLISAAVSVLLTLIEKMPAGQPYICLAPQRYKSLMLKGELNYRMRCEPDNNFNRNFRALCRRAAVQNKTFHDLRKTGLTQLTSDLRLQEVRDIAGHSSVKTTELYLDKRPDYLTRALDSLNRGVAQFG